MDCRSTLSDLLIFYSRTYDKVPLQLVPFVQEVLGQKQRPRGLLKVYMVGAVLALLGTVVGLVDALCQPFTGSSAHDDDADVMEMLRSEEEERRRRRTLPFRRRGLLRGAEAQVQHRDTCLETDA
ncbi:hypothetical protein CRUP_013151, partial [Coryphaenoides rupestris]